MPPAPAPGTDEPAPAPPAPPVARLACADLVGKQVSGADIGVPSGTATVSEATAIAADAAGNPNGAYCKVRGSIAPVNPASPVINFALNLPQAWNSKAMQFGGGGFNGRLIDGTEQIRFGPIDKPTPLASG